MLLGTQRDNDPLLTMEGSLVAMEIMSLLYSAVLVGHPAPKVAEFYDQMTVFPVGIRVVVSDYFYRDNDDVKYKSVGYLIGKERTDDEPGEIYYIQYGPNPEDVCRWSNCLVLRIPTHKI